MGSKSLFLQGNETHCPNFRTAICGRLSTSSSIVASRDSKSAAKSGDKAARNCLHLPHALNDFPHARMHLKRLAFPFHRNITL
jgi:hypothetical protein